MAWPLTSQQSGAERTASALGLRPMLNKVTGDYPLFLDH